MTIIRNAKAAINQMIQRGLSTQDIAKLYRWRCGMQEYQNLLQEVSSLTKEPPPNDTDSKFTLAGVPGIVDPEIQGWIIEKVTE